jgi:hypothetical protein
MKYFTPELWLQTQSGVAPETFLAAYEAWERNIDVYEEQLRRIIPAIPASRSYGSLRRFAEQESLQDAIVLGAWFTSQDRLNFLLQPETPTERLLQLDYTLAAEAAVIPDVLPAQYRTSAIRWMYDELDVQAETAGTAEPTFTHNILLSNGCEVILRFVRFRMARCQALLPALPGAIPQPPPALSQPA